ncbi:chitin synthase chs-2-like [Babylonia areolata]|uniref:chitin synthase chs-2-like n=1 Tax=Babylonia areolata TaxID=304850 RepID=UPI003FCFE764
MRCAVLTEQTLMLRRRIIYRRNFQSLDDDVTFSSEEVSGRTEGVPLIYACATMWHETRKEMEQLMKSIFRFSMDIDRSARFIAQKYYNIRDPDYYDFEAHIFFDDAMKLSNDYRHIPNSFVATFMECLDDAISAVHERPTSLGDPVRTPTPYGGRLTWILPGGTPLVVHMKDKNKIRHKKRWSQVMYMYYLLGYKILANSELQADPEPEFDSVSAKLTSSELRRRRAASHFTRSIIFNYVSEEVQIQAENTYILALDGDVDFKPEAVRLLLDRMKKNTKVGAACGRIHPTGSGPIVWYQKFEYAIGHWLQKATEHVFGCVLCAPGCFSLFRGSALMDDNIVRRYATRSTQAAHYVQYDQGEDRWLSTLLLQQGYRIDYAAAADALTHAPETFSEFFNQRRRWGPSTLANLMDLLGDWRNSVRLNDNLSTIYMVYQCMMLVSTVLGPATIVLLMAGSFRVVFKISVVESYTLALVVPAVYLALCLYCRPALQLRVGAVLSALYALVMTIVLVGTVGTAIDGSVTSPNVLFLFTIILIFSVSGAMHPKEMYCILPGILYLILIPAGYMVLTIYFLCNLHIVSWGTRETHAPTPSQQQEAEKTAQKKKKKKGGILGWLGAHRLVKEMGKVLKQVQETVFHKARQDEAKPSLAQSRTDQLLEELIVELRSRGKPDAADQTDRQTLSSPNPPSSQNGPPESQTLANPSHSHDGQTYASADPQVPSRAHSPSPAQAESPSSEADEQNTLLTSLADQIVAGRDQGKDAGEGVANRSLQAMSDADAMRPSWLTSETCGEGPVTQLTSREAAFWRQLIASYLYPLVEDKAHVHQVHVDLVALRNTVVFGFFMTTAIWVALTMQLEVLQNDLQSYLFIHIPRFRQDQGPQLRFQPLGMFFLGSFAFILLTQFIGMFSHRWGTLLHTLAITDIGIGGQDSEHSKAREAILRVIELQRLRNIELEPEPDYEDPLPDYGKTDNSVTNPVFVPDTPDTDVHDDDDNDDNHHFVFREHPGQTDDAYSLASRPGAAPTSITTTRRRGSGGLRPFQHAHLVPEDGGRGGGGVGHVRGGGGGGEGRGRGPMGNFTLQRAFEKRFRNEVGVGAMMRGGNRRPASSALFPTTPPTPPPPQPPRFGGHVSDLDLVDNV